MASVLFEILNEIIMIKKQYRRMIYGHVVALSTIDCIQICAPRHISVVSCFFFCRMLKIGNDTNIKFWRAILYS